ncbi:MAG: O-antigen ligase family protein [Patescibacteria group bacterium]
MQTHDDPLLKASRLFLFALLLIPVLYWSKLLFLHTTPKTYALYALSELSLVCFLWFKSRTSLVRAPLSPIGKLVLLYLSVLILTSLTGVNPAYSFWGSLDRMGGVLTWLHLVLVFFLAVNILRSQSDWVQFFSFSTLVALAVALVHLFSLGGDSLIPEAHGGSTFGNSSFLAVYLLFHFFFALYVAGEQIKTSRRLVWIMFAAFFFFTLRTISAVAVQYSLLGGIILLVSLLLILTAQRWKRIIGWFVLGALIVSFLATSTLIFVPDSFLHRTFIDLSSGSRFALWDMAWKGIRERPVLGWGLENFGTVSLKYYDACLGSQACGFEMWFDRAHNKVLDVWIESGVVGLSIYLSLFVATLYALNTARKNRRITPFTFVVFVSALATYFVQNLTVLDTNTSLLFWTLILAFGSTLNRPPTEKRTPLSALVPSFATIFLPFLLFFFVIQPVRGNLAFAQTLNATSLQERVEAYERATTLSPLGRDMRRAWLSAQTERVFWNIAPERLKDIESAARIELGMAQAGLKESLTHKSQELRAHIALGIMEQTEGHFFNPAGFEKAEAVLLEAIDLYPLIPQPKWTLAGVYLDMGRADEALALTQDVLSASPFSPQAYNYQLLVLKWMDDEAAFEDLAKKALLAVPALKADIDELRTADISTQSQELLTLFHR